MTQRESGHTLALPWAMSNRYLLRVILFAGALYLALASVLWGPPWTWWG